jgi:LacI family transcriptional regulator
LPPPTVTREFNVDDFRFTSKTRIQGVIGRWVRKLGPKVAIMTPNDLVGRTLLNICQAEDIDVPQDVAILGVDNFLTHCEVSPIPLSSIAQDFPRIGFEAARLLDQMMCQKIKTTAAPVLVPPRRLFSRASSNVWAFDDPIISQTLQAIHEYAATGISMGDLLKRIPLSRKWLDHRFKQSLGHTPTEEIRRCRLRYVRDLLVETDMPLRQITAHCRFPFPENLIRSFKTAYGISPHAYRLLHRSIPNGTPQRFSKI